MTHSHSEETLIARLLALPLAERAAVTVLVCEQHREAGRDHGLAWTDFVARLAN